MPRSGRFSVSNITFAGVLCFVAYIVYEFMDPPLGLDTGIIFVGSVGTIGGMALALVTKLQARGLWSFFTIICSFFVFGLFWWRYMEVSAATPRNCDLDIFCPAHMAILYSFGVFCTTGFLLQIAKVGIMNYIGKRLDSTDAS